MTAISELPAKISELPANSHRVASRLELDAKRAVRGVMAKGRGLSVDVHARGCDPAIGEKVPATADRQPPPAVISPGEAGEAPAAFQLVGQADGRELPFD